MGKRCAPHDVADLGQNARRVGELSIEHDHSHLVAAVPTQDVLRAEALAQRTGQVRQRLVAGDVSVAIVDVVQLVDVEDGNGNRPKVAVGLGQLIVDCLFEGVAGPDAEQRVEQ
jgi:hypothetical protein